MDFHTHSVTDYSFLNDAGKVVWVKTFAIVCPENEREDGCECLRERIGPPSLGFVRKSSCYIYTLGSNLPPVLTMMVTDEQFDNSPPQLTDPDQPIIIEG